MNAVLRLKLFPGALYDAPGTLLAGDGPEMTDELTEELPHKAVISDRPLRTATPSLQEGDRVWVLPDSFGTPPVLPTLLLTDLAHLVRHGRKVCLAAWKHEIYQQARDALMLLLDDSGGRA